MLIDVLLGSYFIGLVLCFCVFIVDCVKEWILGEPIDSADLVLMVACTMFWPLAFVIIVAILCLEDNEVL